MSVFRGSFLIMRQHPRMMSTVPSLSRLRLQDGVDQYEIQVHDKCMAVKTIIIDMEAYEILSRFKDGRKSFSQVIKDELGRKRTGRDLKRVIERLRMSEGAVDAIEAQIRARRRRKARAAKL